MNDDEFTQARKAVDSIRDALGLARVVFVDDANVESISVEDVIAAALTLDEESLLTKFFELGGSIPDDWDVLSTRIRQIWVELDPPLQSERGQAVVVEARRYDSNETDDLADISILS